MRIRGIVLIKQEIGLGFGKLLNRKSWPFGPALLFIFSMID
jgi:hypothetical protein